MLAIANNDHFRADGKPERVAELARDGKRSLAGLGLGGLGRLGGHRRAGLRDRI